MGTKRRCRQIAEKHQGRVGERIVRLRDMQAAASIALLLMSVCTQPGMAQQPNSVDPTASAVKEDQLLQRFKTIQGRGSIPDVKSYTIEQPAGRDWRHFHEVTLRWIGAVAILGILAVLVIFYLWRGMVRIDSGP